MNYAALEDIGLTSGEVKVYLALLKLGSTKTGVLALKAGVSSSKVYKILGRLEQKGLAGHVVKQGVKVYKALESKKILTYLDEKEAELNKNREAIKELLPSLEEQRGTSSTPEATVYSGFKAVTGFYMNILDELEPKEEYKIVGARYFGDIKTMQLFFHKYHQLRAKKGIRVKMLAYEGSRKDVVKPTYKKSMVKFLPESFPTTMQVLFYKDKSFITIWGEEVFGFLIESKQVADSFDVYFENLWKIAKK